MCKPDANPFQEPATKFSKLVGLTYFELLEDYQGRMSLDIFCSMLEIANLKTHLLVFNTPTLETAVHAGNDFVDNRRKTMENSEKDTIVTAMTDIILRKQMLEVR